MQERINILNTNNRRSISSNFSTFIIVKITFNMRIVNKRRQHTTCWIFYSVEFDLLKLVVHESIQEKLGFHLQKRFLCVHASLSISLATSLKSNVIYVQYFICTDFSPNHSTTIRTWHKVNFKRTLTGLNSECSFSFSWLVVIPRLRCHVSLIIYP